MGIYAHRYGYVPDGSIASITETEFHHARKHNKPIFCFIVDDNYSWPPEMIESEPGKTKLTALKAEISSSLVRDTFTTPKDLAYKVATSVGRYLTQTSSRPTEREAIIALEASSYFYVPSDERYSRDDKISYYSVFLPLPPYTFSAK